MSTCLPFGMTGAGGYLELLPLTLLLGAVLAGTISHVVDERRGRLAEYLATLTGAQRALPPWLLTIGAAVPTLGVALAGALLPEWRAACWSFASGAYLADLVSTHWAGSWAARRRGLPPTPGISGQWTLLACSAALGCAAGAGLDAAAWLAGLLLTFPLLWPLLWGLRAWDRR